MRKPGTKRYYIRKTPKGWTVQSWFHGPRPTAQVQEHGAYRHIQVVGERFVVVEAKTGPQEFKLERRPPAQGED